MPAAPRNPAAPFAIQGSNPVRVHIERKGRGGKTVSVIKGVMSPLAGKKALLKLLKSRLGSGGTVREDDIEIQGDRREQIVAILNELGYRAKSAGG
jgi:translation initiation factor 1